MNRSIFFKLWGMPILLAIMSLAGLISALVGDGVWDIVSWLGLGIPLVVMAWFLGKKQQCK